MEKPMRLGSGMIPTQASNAVIIGEGTAITTTEDPVGVAAVVVAREEDKIISFVPEVTVVRRKRKTRVVPLRKVRSSSRGARTSGAAVAAAEEVELARVESLRTEVDPPVPKHPDQIVGGRLQRFYKVWTQITSDKFVLETIRRGYRIEFTGRPRLSRVPLWTNVPKALDKRLALEEGIEKLIAKEAIQLLDPPPTDIGYYSTLFLVEKKGGGGTDPS